MKLKNPFLLVWVLIVLAGLKTASGAPDGPSVEPKTLMVIIKPDQVRVDGHDLKIDGLKAFLIQHQYAEKYPSAILKVDGKTRTGDLVQALDDIKRAGIDDIQIIQIRGNRKIPVIKE